MINYCRLCAESKDSNEIVTTITDAEKLIEQKLTVCCQWKVRNTKQRLPQDVCTICLDKLEKCWIFAQNVKLAQHKLEEIFENEAEFGRDDKLLPPKIVEIIYDCTDCNRAFSSRKAFEEHECNTERVIHQCNICHEKFKTVDALRTHSKKQNDFRCNICLQVFCKLTDLRSHQDSGCEASMESSNLGESKLTFIDCNSEPNLEPQEELPFAYAIIPKAENMEESAQNEDIDNSNHAEESLIDDEPIQSEPYRPRVRNKTRTRIRKSKKCIPNENGTPNDRMYHCYLCDKRFKKWPLLREHMVIHTQPHRFQCQYCPSRFRTERHYTSHQRKHLDYFCDVCSKKFPSAFTLKVHKRVHVGNCVKMYGCEECDHYFVDVSAYYNHAKRRHALNTTDAKKKVKILEPNGTRGPLVCDQCGKDFFSKNRLQQHLIVHLEVREFKCDICPKSFKNKYNLIYHKKRHAKKQIAQCTECGKSFSDKNYLVKHMRIHAGANRKLYQCEFCDKVITNSQSLQIHRRKHTGERPYKCDVCKYESPSRSQLMQHNKSIAHMNKLNESLDLHLQRQNP